MTEQPKKDEIQPKVDLDFLKEIAEHLKSIRSMLTFFTVLAILALIVQACSILL